MFLFFVLGVGTVPLQAATHDEYMCFFTEPFFHVHISLDQKTALYIPDNGVDQERPLPIREVIEVNRTREVVFMDGTKITIDMANPGNDGMSDYNYPYEGIYQDPHQKFYGGCSRWTKADYSEVKRFRGVGTRYGNVMVDYWPGEYGAMTGYRALKDANIDPKNLREHVVDDRPYKGSCTVAKDQQFVPLEGKKGEIYAHVTAANEATAVEAVTNPPVQPGDKVIFLAYQSEGYCLVEKDGQMFSTSCPEMNSPATPAPAGDDPDNVAREEALYGEWVYAQCKEGRSAWIHTRAFADNPDFESVFVEFGPRTE